MQSGPHGGESEARVVEQKRLTKGRAALCGAFRPGASFSNGAAWMYVTWFAIVAIGFSSGSPAGIAKLSDLWKSWRDRGMQRVLIAVARPFTDAQSPRRGPGSAEVHAGGGFQTPTIDQSLEWKSAFNPKIRRWTPRGVRTQSANGRTIVDRNCGSRRRERRSATADVREEVEHRCELSRMKMIAFVSDRPAQISGSTRIKKQLYVIRRWGRAQQLSKIGNRRWRVRVAPDRANRVAATDPSPRR